MIYFFYFSFVFYLAIINYNNYIMNKTLIILQIFICISTLKSQNNIDTRIKIIIDEGKLLYKSEMSSWYGTDLFLENYKERANIGGYFSYSENDKSICVFFSKSEKPKVIGTITFDETFDVKTAKIVIEERDFSNIEFDFYRLRKIALEVINTDTLFKTYKNTNLNLIPLIDKNDKKVFVLTGPTKNGVVIFGNDYLITFDEKNQIKTKKQLHKNIIPINYTQKDENGNDIVGTIHNHLPETGEFITSTDVCTLMLYCKFTKWKTHNVVSDKYLNIWNCETNELNIITMDALNKIKEDQNKRHNKTE